jgi:hypothetical protein
MEVVLVDTLLFAGVYGNIVMLAAILVEAKSWMA